MTALVMPRQELWTPRRSRISRMAMPVMRRRTMGKPSAATGPAYDSMMATLSPTGWWKLNDAVGSASAVDSSGGGHPATVSGTAWAFGNASTPVPGNTSANVGGGSYGSNRAQSTLTIPTGTTSFTSNIWLYFPTWSTSTYYPVVFASTGGSDNKGFSYLATLKATSPSLGFYVGNGTTSITQFWYPGPTNAWHMATLVISGGTMSSYVDGSQVGTSTAVAVVWNASGVTMGNTTGGGNDYPDQVAEAAVWIGTALTATQISNLYAAA